MINDLYRMEDKQVETLFSFDEEVLKKALKNIYSKDFHPMTDIEENLFEATWKTMNKATDKGFGTRKTDDPDYDFYREIRMNNAVFAAFKVHRAQNDMAALLLDKNGSLKPFEQWVKEAMPIADHQMSIGCVQNTTRPSYGHTRPRTGDSSKGKRMYCRTSNGCRPQV